MDFRIQLGVDVNTEGLQGKINEAANKLEPIKLDVELGDIKKELKSFNTELSNIGKSIGTLDSGGSMKNLLTSINKISDALEGVTSQFNGLVGKNGVKGAAQAAQQVARQTEKIISDSASRSIKKISSQEIGELFKVNKIDSDNFENEMNGLVKKWTKGKGNLVDIQIETRTRFDKKEQRNIEELSKAHVTYKNAANESIKKTLEWKQVGVEEGGKGKKKKDTPIMGWVESHAKYQKSVEKTKSQTDRFVKQQKKAVSDLTNQINQLDSDTKDKNANRPIKEQGHLDQLSAKYKEITDAIQRMGSASSDTFDDERNNVNRLISEYKSMKQMFKNAENVAGRLGGDDYESGRKTAEQRFESLKIKAKNYAEMSQTISDLQTKFNAVGDASSLKDFTSQLRTAEAELAKVKVQAKATSQSDILGINKSGLKSDIESLQKANPALKNFKAKINDAEVSVKSLLDELNQVKTQDSFNAVNKRFAEFSKQAKNAGVVVKNTVTNAEQVSKIKEKLKDTGFDGYAEEIKRAHAEMGRFEDSSGKISAALTRLDTAMEAINTADEEQDMRALVEANKEYAAALKQVNSLKKLYEKEERQNYDDESLQLDKIKALLKLENLFESGSQAAKKYGSEMQRLREQIAATADSADIKQVNKEIDILDSMVDRDGLQRQTLTSRIKSQFQKYSQYFSVASIMMEAFQAARNMFEQVKLIDTAMTELKKVTNETDASYDHFLSNAASRAKEIGTTIDGLVTSTADFARLGYDFEQAAGLAEVANIYTVVGDEIDGVETATQSLVSTLAAFKHEMGDMSDSDFAMSIVDKFNEVSNNFAISSGGIGEALQRSASSMAAANNTLDETIALTTAANEVVQNPEKVGNALKTISMRIRGAKTELEEAGESTDGMAESTASLRAEMLALSGVDIMENDDTFKSTYKIMDELSQKWENLSDIQRATITELMAGKHQGNVMSSLMANFDTARAALETSANSAGSAMAEHAKWSESLEARLNKLKATWQSLSQTVMGSDFLKGGIDFVTGFVNVIDGFIDKIGIIPTLLGGFAIGKVGKYFLSFGKDIKSVSDAVYVLQGAFPTLSKVITSCMGAASTAITKFMTAFYIGGGGAGGLLSGFGALLSMLNPVTAIIAGIAATIGAIGYSAYKSAKEAEKLAEKVDKVTSEYKTQHGELKKIQKDYDTTNEESMISRYAKLSKGVDDFGNNLSLTTDEYSEYQNIVGTIADQIPTLISGYDSQGNAILSCKDNISDLVNEYEKLIHVQNQEILTKNGGDIENNWKNTVSQASGYDGWEELGNTFSMSWMWGDDDLTVFDMKESTAEWLDSLTPSTSEKDIEEAIGGWTSYRRAEVIQALQNAGYDVDHYSDISKELSNILKTEPQSIKNMVDNYYAGFEDDVANYKTKASALLSEAFDISSEISGLNYGNISEKLQSIAYQTVNSLDYDSLRKITNGGRSITEWTTEMLDQLNSLDDTEAANIETAFDLKTKFNGGEISYGEYVSGLQEAGSLVDDLVSDKKLGEEVSSQIKLNLGLGEGNSLRGYETYLNRLTDEIGLAESEAEKLLNGLSAQELSVLTKIIPEIDANATREQIEAAIDREMVISGLIFDLNLEVEAAGIESINTALSESVTASGLSSESISALKGRYADLEKQGWDLSSMFEETSHGIHVNRNELSKFENELSKQKLSEIDSDLTKMKATYDDLGEAIKNCKDPLEKSKLFDERQSLGQKISEAATLAHQYKGLTSAYNQWLAAEEAGNERDMYENVLGGFETVKDELSRGWADDSTIAFLEMLTGRTDLAGKSGKELKEVYDGLGKTIENTKYSVKDFFTKDKDGNSTSKGVYNFLDAIGQLEEEKFGYKDIVKRDGKGNIIGFDFELAGGDEVIAEALGVSEELVQIMVRAADDAGFVVSMDGTYRQLADLQNEARAAVDVINDLFGTEYTFDFNTSNVDKLTDDLEKAKKILDKTDKDGNKLFWNDDGTYNFDAEGATEAMQIVSTLQAKLDTVSQEKYGIGLTVEDKQLEEPLEKLQDYGHKVAQLNQLKLNPKANADEIEKLEGDLETIAEDLIDLSKKGNIEIGIEEDDSPETVMNKISKGEIKIPTTLDIQTNIDKGIQDLKDIALLTSGLLSEEQEEAIKIRLGIEVEPEVENPEAVGEEVKNEVETNTQPNLPTPTIETPIEIKPVSHVQADKFLEENGIAPSGQLEGRFGIVLKPEVKNPESVVEKVEETVKEEAGGTTTVEKSVELDLSVKEYQDVLQSLEEADKDITISITTNGLEDVVELSESLGEINKNISLTASIDGEINKLSEFVDNIKELDSVKNKNTEVSIKASFEGDLSNTESIKNLAEFASGAKALNGVNVKNNAISLSVTANLDGTSLDSENVTRLKAFADGANALKNTKESTNVTVTANLISNLKTWEGNIDDLITFADGANALKNTKESTNVTVTATIEGDLNSESVSNLKNFADAVNSLPTSAVNISVKATVETTSINTAITLLTQVASSGLFKDYKANVTVAATGKDDVDNLKGSIDKVKDKNVKVSATTSGEAALADLKSAIDAIQSKTVTVTVNTIRNSSSTSSSEENPPGGETTTGESPAAGTAYYSGSAFANGNTGRAFAHGDWGIKGNGVALGGEMGPEIVVRDGRFFTIGDKGAEFFRYKKNDIVFNATQTEALFKYGGLKGTNPRGKMLASGTAFSIGSSGSGGGFWGSNTIYSGSSKSSKSSKSSDKKNNSNSDSNSESEESKNEIIDWIEKLLDRFDRAIDSLDKAANNIYKSFSKRNTALNNEIAKVNQQIANQQKAYDRYTAEANNVGKDGSYNLSEEWKKKIRNGDFDISVINDEKLVEYIGYYEEWYEKALDAKEAIEDLKETLASLYAQKLENVDTKYEGILGVVEHEKNIIEENINQSEARGWIVSGQYYGALANNERENIAQLEKEKAEKVKAFNEAMASGAIDKGSEAYYEMVNSIDETTLAIEEGNTRLLEYEQTMQQLDWEVFDILQEKISAVSDEAEFLIELLGSDKLYDDNGKLTDEGKATMGLRASNYNTYMYQADLAGKEAKRLEEEIEKDPYDQELQERHREVVKSQQDFILAAQQEKEAIRDLVEEGIQLELDALDERIEKYKDSLDSARDLYEYNKKVKEQSEEIANLEKQRLAYQNDDSEEAKAKLQEIEVSLKKAEEELAETEMDRLIENSEKLLDNLLIEYEETLNGRLDNIDALVEQVVEEVNTNASTISGTINDAADKVGYTLSDSMKTIWNEDAGSAKNVVTTYGDKFLKAQTTTNTALNSINTNLQNMISQLNKEATAKTKAASTSSVAKSSSTKKTTTTKTTTKKSSGGDGKPKIGDKVKYVSGRYYYDSQGKKPLGSRKKGEYVYITNINKKGSHPYHISTGNKLGKGDLGWLKLNQISGYATGKKNFMNNEVAWTQENGEEFIIRPSDGAILTPIAKSDSVLSSVASNNIWQMANSPAEFIKDNLNLGSANVPNNSNVQSNYTQHLDKVIFNLPNVQNYEQLLSAMQKDKHFEKLIHSMTVDRLAGKSALAKGKSLR